MNAVDAELTDPRYVTEVVDHPLYRVDFWVGADASEEWILRGASDYAHVLDWANERAGGRAFVIYAQADSASSTLLRLHESEPA
ncbi:MAG: hypothetical protein DI566_13270 [Microbacterium sp.]|nr:MAG: hypothetical protein DI566_13270 [Microbacterium sp.]